KRRLKLHEPYRTVLGHFRHESAHYYWDRLIKDSDRIDGFRQRVGDEREDYGKALKRYYQEGAPADWQQRFLSAYASSHPWEHWEEPWGHSLHMPATLERAIGWGMSLGPRRPDEPILKPNMALPGGRPESFDQMIERWFSLTYVLN